MGKPGEAFDKIVDSMSKVLQRQADMTKEKAKIQATMLKEGQKQKNQFMFNMMGHQMKGQMDVGTAQQKKDIVPRADRPVPTTIGEQGYGQYDAPEGVNPSKRSLQMSFIQETERRLNAGENIPPAHMKRYGMMKDARSGLSDVKGAKAPAPVTNSKLMDMAYKSAKAEIMNAPGATWKDMYKEPTREQVFSQYQKYVSKFGRSGGLTDIPSAAPGESQAPPGAPPQAGGQGGLRGKAKQALEQAGYVSSEEAIDMFLRNNTGFK